MSALVGLADAQSKQGHDVEIVASSRGSDSLVEPKLAKISLVHCEDPYWTYNPHFKITLEQSISRVDIVHLHMVWDYPIWLAAKMSLNKKKRFVLSPHGQLERWSLSQKRFKKYSYLTLFGAQVHHASRIHFTTISEKNNSPILNNIPYFITPFGVNFHEHNVVGQGAHFFDRFPQLKADRSVLYLGRIHPKKQPEILIEAFSKLPFCDTQLIFAGPGAEAYINKLRSQANILGILKRTSFIGPLLNTDVLEAYRAASVFALPSQQENFGVSIIEAMAAGCPVLISDKIGLAKEIQKARAGLVFEPTAGGFQQGLCRLLSNPAFAKTTALKGRHFVKSRYAWKPIADSFTKEYEAVLHTDY